MVDVVDPASAKALFKASQNTPSVKEYVLDVKIKAWVNNDWGTLLAAAPVCLELLGSCCLVASTSVAQTTELSKPDKGFNYLKGYKYLAPTLVEVTNRGDSAFRLAREKMADIRERCGAVKNNVKEIFFEVKEPEFDSASVVVEMETLLEAANACEADAKLIHKETEVRFNTVKDEEEAKKIEQEERERYYKEYEEKVKKIEAKLEEHDKRYKELLDKFPTGDDLLKQQLIMIAAETASSLVKILGKAVAAKISPMSVFSKDDNSKGGKSKGSSTGKKRKAAEEDDDEDPALVHCPLILRALEGLDAIVRGKDGVDWDLVADTADDDDNKKDSKKSKAGSKSKLKLGVVTNLLTQARSMIRKDPDERSSKGGKALLKILKEALDVAGELEKEGSKAKKTKGSELPKKDSTTVKEWQKKVQEFLKKTRKLRSQANASAGSPTPTPLFAPDDDDTQQNAERMDINAATIEAARAALKTAQKTMLSTQETARQMDDKALELQFNLATLRREIHELGQQRITLEVVRGVLQDCIRFLIQLKVNMNKLIAFFAGVARMLSIAVQTQDHVLMRIYQYALNIAANFDLYKDVATMYCTVHDNHIQPGITIVNRMALLSEEKGADNSLAAKKLELRDYVDNAEKGIKAIVKAKSDEFAAGYADRIKSIKDLLGSVTVPALHSDQAKAIEEGAQEAADAFKERIDFNNSALQSLTQPREVRSQHAKELAQATDPQHLAKLDEERKKEREERRRRAQAEHEDY
ncbi:hypothetical protein VTN00DRAFT_3268 [Thermoascus crustaceus]|uniref:uncharacterized protein n=1 Tax=Thermoascus crustaceus TaxID=5088 RepID=UPI003744AAA3